MTAPTDAAQPPATSTRDAGPPRGQTQDLPLRPDLSDLTLVVAPTSPLRPTTVLAVSTVLSAGTALMVLSFHLATTGDQRHLQFAAFWAGLLGGTLLLTALLARPDGRPLEHALLCLALAGFTSVPKLLRNGGGPLFSDEFAHSRQTQHLVETGLVEHASPLIKALPAFPGLHAVTASLVQVAGVSVWSAALVVMVGAHLLALLGVYALLSQAAGVRIAALGAALYTTNSSWLFFDLQFAYETLALPLVLWAMVYGVRAVRHAGRTRVRSVGVSVVLTLAAAVTHHLSTIVLMLLLTGHAAIVTARRRPGESVATAWLLVAGLLTCALAWLLPSWNLLVGYLAPSLTRSWQQLQALVARVASTAPAPTSDPNARTSHKLFAGTTLPPYEVVAGVALPFVLIGVVTALWVTARRCRRRGEPPVLPLAQLPSSALLLTGLGLLYFGSLPFLLTAGGSEGARRTWAFSFIGLAMLCSAFYLWSADRARRGDSARWATLRAGFLALLVLVTVGGVAVGQNEAYRFPGPYTVGSDTLSQDAERRAAARWMRTNLGVGHKVVADRYLGLSLGSLGEQQMARPSDGFPAWDLVFSDTPPRQDLIRQLRESKYAYLVIDGRMAVTAPALGRWFTVDEPRPPGGTVPPQALDRFQCLPFSSAVYASQHITVYRLDYSAYDVPATAAAARNCR